MGCVAGRRQAVKDALYNRLYRRRVLNCFDFTEQRVGYFLREVDRYRPDVLVAYTNPLYAFARALDEQGLRPFSPRSIVAGAERLHDFQRSLIEKVFRAPVFETYGCREVMLIGAQCERRSGLHLTAEHLLVELVDDDGKPTPCGEEGNVVVTDLYNYGMPFVRYLNGDRAVARREACPCGRGLPLLETVVGRRLDILTTADGRLVAGELFPHLMQYFPAVRRFQVAQLAPDDIRLRLVVRRDWTPADAARVEATVRKTVGNRTRLAIELVDDIPLTGTGKLQVVVNLCDERSMERGPAPAGGR